MNHIIFGNFFRWEKNPVLNFGILKILKGRKHGNSLTVQNGTIVEEFKWLIVEFTEENIFLKKISAVLEKFRLKSMHSQRQNEKWV